MRNNTCVDRNWEPKAFHLMQEFKGELMDCSINYGKDKEYGKSVGAKLKNVEKAVELLQSNDAKFDKILAKWTKKS